MVSEAGHYPQSQRPDLTAAAVPRFLEAVKGASRTGHIQASGWEEARWIIGEVAVPQSRK
jgi:hypothetical protein